LAVVLQSFSASKFQNTSAVSNAEGFVLYVDLEVDTLEAVRSWSWNGGQSFNLEIAYTRSVRTLHFDLVNDRFLHEMSELKSLNLVLTQRALERE
jgi:hypothetical protein